MVLLVAVVGVVVVMAVTATLAASSTQLQSSDVDIDACVDGIDSVCHAARRKINERCGEYHALEMKTDLAIIRTVNIQEY